LARIQLSDRAAVHSTFAGGAFMQSSMASTEEIKLIRMLLERLERVSVDSYWAHRASGIRGGLIQHLEEMEKGEAAGQVHNAELISSAFDILTRAAREKR
jgi:hypothetical protein